MLVIEGDQARRRWQWQLPDVPLRVANYELLCATATLPAGRRPPLHFDLVVLDESQRIKNRASTTSEVVRSISAAAELGADRHAGREQRRRPGGHFRVPRPRASSRRR